MQVVLMDQKMFRAMWFSFLTGLKHDRIDVKTPLCECGLSGCLYKYMNTKRISVYKTQQDLLISLGKSIREKRKMRMITIKKLSEELQLSRTTLDAIENGSPSVSIGAYLNVMYLLGYSYKLLELVRWVRASFQWCMVNRKTRYLKRAFKNVHYSE